MPNLWHPARMDVSRTSPILLLSTYSQDSSQDVEMLIETSALGEDQFSLVRSHHSHPQAVVESWCFSWQWILVPTSIWDLRVQCLTNFPVDEKTWRNPEDQIQIKWIGHIQFFWCGSWAWMLFFFPTVHPWNTPAQLAMDAKKLTTQDEDCSLLW